MLPTNHCTAKGRQVTRIKRQEAQKQRAFSQHSCKLCGTKAHHVSDNQTTCLLGTCSDQCKVRPWPS